MNTLADFFALVFFSPLITFHFILWALAMVTLPIASHVTPRHRETAITSSVVIQALLISCILFSSGTAALLPILLVPLLGWLAEFIGSRTGIPFGAYRYTKKLQPQLGGVPLTIPLAWLMMMPPAWAVGAILVPGDHPVLRALVSAAAFTGWDFYLDPQMVHWGYWQWKKRGAYLGIPLINFVGWFLWAFVISLLAGGVQFHTEPLFFVFITHWALQFGGQLFFWRMPMSAFAGFIAMGATIVPALIRYLF